MGDKYAWLKVWDGSLDVVLCIMSSEIVYCSDFVYLYSRNPAIQQIDLCIPSFADIFWQSS